MQLKELIKSCHEKHGGDKVRSRICVICEEFRKGFAFMQKYPKSVTIFGSARLAEDNFYAQKATELAKKLAEKGYAIVTGGGHGIMGAAHKGASLVHGDAVGFNIELPFEQSMNHYITDAMEFHHFFSRKVILAYSAEAYIYFPGGFGTMDELFEILTLLQTKKIPPLPVFLFGSDFWNPIFTTFKQILLEENHTISPEDLEIFTITDDIQEIVDKVLSSKTRFEHPIHQKEFEKHKEKNEV